MQDDLDDFVEYDVTMGLDTVKCPHCGAKVPRSLFLGEEVECPKCGEKIEAD